MSPAPGPGGGAPTLAQTGEFGLIRLLGDRYAAAPADPRVLLGPGDDAAVVTAPDARVVATTDLVVENRHFRRSWSSAHDVGRRAAARNLADVVAMGAVPTGLLVGFAAPPDLPTAWALELADGLRDECALVGATVVGGDVSSADAVLLGVTALGDLEGRAPVLRSGARPGDDVVLVGRLGWAAAGLAVLQRGFRSPRAVVDAHRVPRPPYAAGPALADAGATAMCDVSDGLLADLGHIAAASGVLIDLRTDAFSVPDPLRDVGSALRADPLEWVLTGGDDHALVATLPPGAALPEGAVVVGSVRVAAEGGPQVLVDGAAYGAGESGGGHRHFAR